MGNQPQTHGNHLPRTQGNQGSRHPDRTVRTRSTPLLRMSESAGEPAGGCDFSDVVPVESFYVLAEWRSDGDELTELDGMDERIPVWNEYVIVVVGW